MGLITMTLRWSSMSLFHNRNLCYPLELYFNDFIPIKQLALACNSACVKVNFHADLSNRFFLFNYEPIEIIQTLNIR